jgi:putative ATP-binding cassette transporter
MNYFLSLLRISRKIFGNKVIFLGITAGISNTALISIINETIKNGYGGKLSLLILAACYVGAMGIYFLMQYFYQALLIKSSEVLIIQSRLTLIEKIRKSSLRSYEKIGSTPLFVLVAHNTNTIGQIASLTSSVIISAIVIFGSLVYLLFLSLKGFLVTIFIIGVSLFIAFSTQKANIRRIRILIDLENVFLGYLRSMLDGIKEVKMDSRVNEDIYQLHVRPSMEEVSTKKANNNIFQARFSLLGQLIFFLTMGFILYVFPYFHIQITANPSQFVITLLYILGPVQMLIPLVPQFSQIKATMDRIETVRETLETEEAHDPGTTAPDSCGTFSSISIRNLTYAYTTLRQPGDFSLGPINLDIHAGDLIFIHGENGSGKSTLIKVLSGLYPVHREMIWLDGQPIDANNLQQYRNMFGVIFTDNHLFEYIYGAGQMEPATVRRLISKTGLEKKVRFEDNRFDTIELSEGQKKRIALISLLLKDKSIYIFDEWAANQDPEFRDFFYKILIRELSDHGKTVIIITHDDRYLHLAKRIIKMEDGRLREIPSPVVSNIA